MQKYRITGDALSPLLFNQVGLKLNGTYQLLTYVNDVKLLSDNIDTIKKNTETLIDANKESLIFIPGRL
jgi:hypothetical protein